MGVRATLALIAAGGIIGAAIVGSTPAHADTNDDAFLVTLVDYGVPEPAGPLAAITDAHSSCAAIRSGYSPIAVVTTLYRQIGPYTLADAEHFVGAAIGAYCPDQGYKIGVGTNGQQGVTA